MPLVTVASSQYLHRSDEGCFCPLDKCRTGAADKRPLSGQSSIFNDLVTADRQRKEADSRNQMAKRKLNHRTMLFAITYPIPFAFTLCLLFGSLSSGDDSVNAAGARAVK